MAKTRVDAQAQGIQFTRIDGIGEETYDVLAPNFRAYISRRSTLGVTLNIGSELTGNDTEARKLLKKIIDGGG